jgi:membrane protein DedA with SNARE-associated domain
MIEWLDALLREAGLLGLLVVFVAAALEYVFPPFPGDTATVFGGVFAVRAGFGVPLVFAVLMAGSLLGAAIDYAFGLWLGRRMDAQPHRERHLRFITREQLHAWERRFRERAVWWLVANRFLPGIRGPIFFAAGLARVPVARALLWGGVSALLWNALLFAAGYAVGGQAEALERLVRTYSRGATLVLGAAFALWAGRAVLRRIRARRAAPPARR